VQVVGLTNRGLERARNEDSVFVKTENGLGLLVVADGMGGHRAGNIASSLAVSAAEKFWANFDCTVFPNAEEAHEMIRTVIREANEEIIVEAGSSSARHGMGTTLTIGLLCGSRVTIGHIGDSRAYLLNDSQIKLLTRDHSLLEQLIDTGQVRPEEARNHPQRHVLTRALGITSDLQIDIIEREIEPGSILLFCTDGLTNLISDEEILAAYSGQRDPQLLAESLIDLANSRGGPDNITVAIASDIGGKA
jgi:PPM family protein phosphatase